MLDNRKALGGVHDLDWAAMLSPILHVCYVIRISTRVSTVNGSIIIYLRRYTFTNHEDRIMIVREPLLSSS